MARMLRRTTARHQTCSIAATLEVVGERWSLLIVRDVLLGVRRFDELQADLGVARNVLQARLERLIDAGVLERRRYQEHPPRYEYLLTEKGLDLWPTIVALLQWGDKSRPDPGRPAGPARAPRLRRRGRRSTGSASAAGAAVGPRDSVARPGPGARPDHPLRRRECRRRGRRAPEISTPKPRKRGGVRLR